jgi:hypothetical protein
MNCHLRLTTICFAILSASSAYASCGSSACSINTNWDEHSPSKPGISMDLRYSESKSDVLRSGSRKIVADTFNNGEVENLNTVNRITTLGIDYTRDEHWGVALIVPYISREHSHSLGDGTGAIVGSESFSAKSLGDIKVIGRYRWPDEQHDRASRGIKIGLKLHTGRQDFQMVDNLGASKLPSEVTLQPGNGSTDFIFGTFWQVAPMASDLSWFTQAIFQTSIQHKTEYKPGSQLNMDAGMRYAMSSRLSGLLQLNAQWIAADQGTSAALTAAGEASSGGTILSLTPGLSYAIVTGTNLYGLVQLPLYQYVNGEQLTASRSVTVGINQRF